MSHHRGKPGAGVDVAGVVATTGAGVLEYASTPVEGTVVLLGGGLGMNRAESGAAGERSVTAPG